MPLWYKKERQTLRPVDTSLSWLPEFCPDVETSADAWGRQTTMNIGAALANVPGTGVTTEDSLTHRVRSEAQRARRQREALEAAQREEIRYERSDIEAAFRALWPGSTK